MDNMNTIIVDRLNLEIVNKLDVSAWRQFVANHPDGNIYHTPEMFQVFSQTSGCQPEIWAAVNHEGQILSLLLPVHVTLNNSLLRRLTTRTVVYGGVLVEPSPSGREALAALLEAYKQNSGFKSVFTELRNISSCADIQPVLQQAGFVYEDHLNYLVKLEQPSDRVFDRIGHRTQKNIRRGLKRELVQIEEARDPAVLDEGYALVKKTYQNARVPLADKSLFAAAFNLLSPTGMFMVTTAKVRGVLAAVSYELIYKDIVTGWYGGMDRAFTQYVPNELLMWHILRQCSGSGYRVYDFGGAGKPNEEYGVRDFKAKFGGELVCYGRNTWIPNPRLLKVSKLGYSFYRSLLSLRNGHNGTKNDDSKSISG